MTDEDDDWEPDPEHPNIDVRPGDLRCYNGYPTNNPIVWFAITGPLHNPNERCNVGALVIEAGYGHDAVYYEDLAYLDPL